MQTNDILHLLRKQETEMLTEIRKTQKRTPKDTLTVMKLLFIQLNRELLKSTINVLWTMHLLKTSIFVTKTPLTTFKSLSKAAINQSFTIT